MPAWTHAIQILQHTDSLKFPRDPSFLDEGPVMDWKSSLGVLSQQLLPEWCQVGTIPKIAALSTVSSAIFISPIITMPL